MENPLRPSGCERGHLLGFLVVLLGLEGPPLPGNGDNSSAEGQHVCNSTSWPQCMLEHTAPVCGNVCVCVTCPQPWFPIFSIQSLDARGALPPQTHTRSVRVDLTLYTGHAYVEIGQTRLISSDRTCIYHHPRGARWARGPRWSLRSLNTIVALLKAEIFSPTLIIIIMSAEQSDTCVIWTHFFTFDPREPFPPTFPSDPRGPLTTHTGAEGVTTTTPKARPGRRGAQTITYWWSWEAWLSLETLEIKIKRT